MSFTFSLRSGARVRYTACGVRREWMPPSLAWVVVKVTVMLLMFVDADALMFGDVDCAVDDEH